MKYCMPFVFFYEMEARKFIALGTGGIPFVMAAIFFWELFDRPSQGRESERKDQQSANLETFFQSF